VNPTPTLAMWLQTLLVLAAGAAIVMGLAAFVSWKVRSGAGRRAIWQAATLGLAVLFLGEMSGLGASLCTWLTRTPSSSREEILSPDVPAAGLGRPYAEFADPATVPQAEEIEDKPVPDTPSFAAEAPSLAAEVRPAAVWWPGVVWLLGAAAVGTRACLARLLLVLFRRRHGPSADTELQRRVAAVAARLGLRRSVLVLEADGLRCPAAFGIVWPTVAVPSRFTEEFTPAQQEAMLAHEIGHLALGDPAWHQLADLVVALWWWHPLAWWVRHRLRAASELAADEASVVVVDGPGVLAGCLVELGGRLAGVREGAWVRMAGSGFRSSLGRRVERLMRLDGGAWQPAGRLRRGVFLTLASAALLAAALLSTAWARSQAFPEGDVAMQTVNRSWRRSLAAMALVAALGPTSDAALGGPQPGGGGSGGGPGVALPDQPSGQGLGGGARGDKDDKEKSTSKQQTLEKQLADLDVELAALEAKVTALQELRRKLREVEAQPGKQTEKVESQLKSLQEKATQLGESKAAVEAQIAALQEKKAEAATPRIKVFRLQHRDAEEVRDVLAKLLPLGEGAAGGDAGGGAMMGGFGGPRGGSGMMPPGGMMPGGGGRPGGGRSGGMGSGMGPPGGAPPGMGGTAGFGGGAGSGGMMGMGGSGQVHGWRLAVDGRTNCLVVRGSEHDLQMASDLVAMLDLPEGKPMPRLKNIRAFKLKFADPEQVAMMLQALEINATIAPAPKATLLIVSGSEAAMKEVAEVIEAVDVQGKPATGTPGGKGGGTGNPP
jgi:hypothetical protein